MDASLWDAVRARLGAQAGTVREGGYFGSALAASAEAGPIIAVGHSLGVMQLLAARPDNMVGMIAINGFTRFTAFPDHPHGMAPRLLERMMQRLDQDGGATVAAFRTRCGLTPGLPAPVNLPALKQGLELLYGGDCRAALHGLPAPVLAVAGCHDGIVPPALSQACFDKLQWVGDGGHLLPLTHPDLCAQLLLGFASQFA